MSRGPSRYGLLAILLGALLVRLAVMAPVAGRPPDDPDHYLALARSLGLGEGFSIAGRPTAYRPPLYPLLLTPLAAGGWVKTPRAIFALHLFLALGTVAMTSVAARRWGLSPGRGLLAAAIVALDPVLVVQARSTMTETLAAFLVALTLSLAAGPRGAVLGGMGLGLMTLCRPSFLPAAALVAGSAWLAGPGEGRSRAIRAVSLACVTLGVVSPWAIRNVLVMGEPVWGTTHGGYTMALANNPIYYAEVLDGPTGSVWGGAGQQRWWRDVARQTAGLSEPEADRSLRRSTLRLMYDRPLTFARASLARLGRFWGLEPSGAVYPRSVRVATACWTLPLWCLLICGLSRRPAWCWPRLVAPILLVSLTIVHVVYWSDLRMRAPLVPAIALLAALGCPAFMDRWLSEDGWTGSRRPTPVSRDVPSSPA